jgi:hypothetical protein
MDRIYAFSIVPMSNAPMLLNFALQIGEITASDELEELLASRQARGTIRLAG